MSDVSITYAATGPYLIKGPIDLSDSDGKAIELPEGRTVALCRCGASVNKPFCDGTHSKIGFEAANKAVADA